jgi:hypothetical protein
VKSAGVESGGANVFFQPQGQPPAAPGQEPTAAFKMVTPHLLNAMGTRLIAGRNFGDHDNQGSAPVAIISETIAQYHWPKSSPLGRHVTLIAHVYSGQQTGPVRSLEIVGVAKDVRNDDLWRPEAAIYVPFAQSSEPSSFVVVRTSLPPVSIVPVLRSAVRSIDNELPMNRVKTMEDIVSETYGAIRFPNDATLDPLSSRACSLGRRHIRRDLVYRDAPHTGNGDSNGVGSWARGKFCV